MRHVPSCVVKRPSLRYHRRRIVDEIMHLAFQSLVDQSVEQFLHLLDEERIGIKFSHDTLKSGSIGIVCHEDVGSIRLEIAKCQVLIPNRPEEEFSVCLAVSLDSHQTIPVARQFSEYQELHPRLLVVVGSPTRYGISEIRIERRFPYSSEPLFYGVDDGVALSLVVLVGGFWVFDIHQQTTFREAHRLVEHARVALEFDKPSRILVDIDAVRPHITVIRHLVSASVVAIDDHIDVHIARSEGQSYQFRHFTRQGIL